MAFVQRIPKTEMTNYQHNTKEGTMTTFLSKKYPNVNVCPSAHLSVCLTACLCVRRPRYRKIEKSTLKRLGMTMIDIEMFGKKQEEV